MQGTKLYISSDVRMDGIHNMSIQVTSLGLWGLLYKSATQYYRLRSLCIRVYLEDFDKLPIKVALTATLCISRQQKSHTSNLVAGPKTHKTN